MFNCVHVFKCDHLMIGVILFYVCFFSLVVSLSFLSLSLSLWSSCTSFDDDDDDDAEYLRRSTFMKHITHVIHKTTERSSRTKTLFRFLGLGHMRGVGMDLPYRQRFQFLLELIYGDTFKPKAFWARHRTRTSFSTRCFEWRNRICREPRSSATCSS